MTQYIGIDIGGTNIRIGAIDENEKLVFEYKEATYKNVVTSEDLYKKIKTLIKKIPNYNDAKAIGIGIPGSINLKGEILTSGNVNILKNFPIAEKLNKDFGKPIYIENDARIATLAEAIKGKGKDKKIVCYITISTGLGGGLAINKEIYHGSNNLGAYLGRMILDGKNTSDSLISGTALLKQAKQKISKNIKQTSELFDLEENGDFIAKEIVTKFKENLTILLLNISSIINPDIIVLGGGVINSKDRFLEDVINNFKKEAHILAKGTIIDVAEFKEPGIIGGALLGKYNFQNNYKKI